MAKLPPVPLQSPIQGALGKIPQIWADWFEKIFQRVGGVDASTNTELQTQIDEGWAPGDVKLHAGTTVQSGWLLCDGSAVSRTTYADLFTAIGTKWGVGDGSTTFNLPPGGIFPVAYKSSGTFTTVGGTGGAESTTLPNHIHPVDITSDTESAETTAGVGSAVAVTADEHTHDVTGNTGNPTTNPSIATLPPYGVFKMVIKT